MNDSTRVMRRLRRVRPPVARTAAAIIAMAVLVLLAAACGGRPSSTGSGGSSKAGGPVSSRAANSKTVAFSHCMRSHGVPAFPDPTRMGGVPKVTPQQVGVSNSQFQVAQRACAHLLQPAQAQVPQIMTGMVNFARCMRSHGVPNWPDPSAYSQDPLRPTFNLHAAGIGFHLGAQPGNVVNSPQIQAKVRQCESVVHLNVSGWYQ